MSKYQVHYVDEDRTEWVDSVRLMPNPSKPSTFILTTVVGITETDNYNIEVSSMFLDMVGNANLVLNQIIPPISGVGEGPKVSRILISQCDYA